MRLFIATRLGEVEAARVHRGLAPAKSRASRAAWVAPHAYHLTYAFIGEQDESAAARIAESLETSLAGLPRYDGSLSGGGFFPSARRPRVGWLALDPPEPLISVSVAVRSMLDTLGVSFDRKPFRPHLTVVRIRDRWSGRDVAEFEHACAAMGRIDVALDRVSLFRSELRPDGARHHEMALASLGE